MDINTWNSQAPYLTALELAKTLGISMIPLGPDKETIVNGSYYNDAGEEVPSHLTWKINQARAMSELFINIYHEEYSPPLWAMVTGKVSGIITLDYDGAAG